MKILLHFGLFLYPALMSTSPYFFHVSLTKKVMTAHTLNEMWHIELKLALVQIISIFIRHYYSKNGGNERCAAAGKCTERAGNENHREKETKASEL